MTAAPLGRDTAVPRHYQRALYSCRCVGWCDNDWAATCYHAAHSDAHTTHWTSRDYSVLPPYHSRNRANFDAGVAVEPNAVAYSDDATTAIVSGCALDR